MSVAGSRQNYTLLLWLRALAFAAGTWLALTAMQFRPTAGAVALSLATGVIALFSTEIATVAFVLVASMPLLAANALVGLIFLVVGLASAQYLGADDIPVFVVVAAAFVMAALGPVWAVPVLAGYVLSSSRGALAAAVACVALEAAGLLLGTERLGVVFLGGAHGFVSFSKAPDNLLAIGWLAPAFKSITGQSAKNLWQGVSNAKYVGVLLLQPAAWALGAAIAGRLRRPADHPQQLLMGIAAAVAGVLVVAVGSVALLVSFKVEPSYGAVVTHAGLSMLIAGLGTVVWDRVFKVNPRPAPPVQPVVAQRGVMAEDADVDELLRLIATAEDKIANQHTTETIVMITDMKSFTSMTEEEGSFVTAKAIQRHRDLLLPVIEARGGRGKSTGGDGLIASFESEEQALCAAIDMQRTLERHNAEHERERDILIRVGIASGEVVLDKGGRPFIGAAVNLSARVMSLGDGGQVLATREIVSKAKAPGVVTVSHGEFELKNIAHPVEVLEVLWHDGQAPCDPRTLFAPSPLQPASLE